MKKTHLTYERRELKALCERRTVEPLTLFGSALRDDFDPDGSDLGFSVECQSMTPHEHAESYFGLLEDLKTCSGGVLTWWRWGLSETPTCAGRSRSRSEP